MNTLFKIALAATAVAASTAAFAKADEQRFTDAGYTYVYSVTQKADTQEIRGKYYPGGRAFALRVRNERVRGTVDGSTVNFPVSAAAQATGALASAD